MVTRLTGRRGAALIVLLAVVVAMELGVLVSFRMASLAVRRSDEAELKFRLRAMKSSIELYKQRFNRYPARLDDLLVLPPNPRLLRRIYTDPMVRSAAGYASFRTVQGTDGNLISNVASTSPLTALDGTRYDQWSYDEKLRFITGNSNPNPGSQPLK